MMPQTICNLCLGHLSHMGNNRLLLLLQGGGGGAYTVQRSAAGARSPQLTSTLPPEEGAADTLKYPALARNRSALDPEWLTHHWNKIPWLTSRTQQQTNNRWNKVNDGESQWKHLSREGKRNGLKSHCDWNRRWENTQAVLYFKNTKSVLQNFCCLNVNYWVLKYCTTENRSKLNLNIFNEGFRIWSNGSLYARLVWCEVRELSKEGVITWSVIHPEGRVWWEPVQTWCYHPSGLVRSPVWVQVWTTRPLRPHSEGVECEKFNNICD